MRSAYIFIVLLGLFFVVPNLYTFCQVSISGDGSDADPSAGLDVNFINKGLLPPRMTNTQMYAIVNPANGLIIYCTNCSNSETGALAMFINGAWYIFAPTCILPHSPSAEIHAPTPSQIIWNWNTVPNATGYKWGTTNNYQDATDMGTATTRTETGLTCNTAYTRYAWAYNACGNSIQVSLTQSTTLDPPAVPTAGTHVPLPTQITWNWNTVAGATGYKWSAANIYAGATDMGTATSKTETGLTCNNAYTRYIWAYSDCGNSTSLTLTQSTSLNPPAAPTAGTPVLSLTQITWNWNTVADATGYKWNTTDNFATATDMGTSTTNTETGLTCGTPYTRYVWAYNWCGTSFVTALNQSTVPCPVLPTVTTTAATNIALTTATSGGNVTWDGGATVTERGVCYSTSPNPTISGSKTIDGNGPGIFSSNLSVLLPTTLYYTKAYATNSVGTGYGAQVSFTTLAFAAGQAYGGGIIFYLDGTGQHGLISATTDQSTGATWGCYPTSIPGTSMSVGTGQSNTTIIVNGCGDAGIAARICNDLVLNGYDDWFLPSIDELGLIHDQRTAIGGFASDYYWSSSQNNGHGAYGQDFSWLGDWNDFAKTNTMPIRCVRHF